MTIALSRPTTDLFESWASAVAEFEGGHVDGAGIEKGLVPDRAACEAFVEMAALFATPGAALPEGRVPCDYFWITEGDEVVGFIAFRRELNEWLRRFGGHIGYSVIPSRRREGIVREALRLMLRLAKAEGYEWVMLTCDDDNVGSIRTIEGAGGELEDVIDAPEPGQPRVRRYWIDISGTSLTAS
ncbi:GNAT family N-acetyltransferase [Microbacterium oxydans]|uniref:GNAT family N-acetyltransferase n=1 Tax=Microbacterium oxydans TaxID=82380 RepID=UPI0022B1EB3A|nr:GNAT family N-acetyltransferase [Microbacterium oxydans]MCZ4302040.1 GNAT family N-acetyltransferase [Microbacterium oxydans]